MAVVRNKNERLPTIIPRKWKVLRARTHVAGDEEMQLRLKIGELEQLIVGTEERESRRRAMGILPPETAPGRLDHLPMRYDEKRVLQRRRIKGWFAIALLGVALIVTAAWLFHRVLVVL